MIENAQAAVYPLPRFYFKVNLGTGGGDIPFQEVSGLDTEPQIIEYRTGNSPALSTIKIPGRAKMGNVILKKGIFVQDNKFWAWYSTIKLNLIKRTTVVIMLCDEGGNATITWTLHNAWPTKIQGTDLKADGNEVAVETLDVAYETITIRTGE